MYEAKFNWISIRIKSLFCRHFCRSRLYAVLFIKSKLQQIFEIFCRCVAVPLEKLFAVTLCCLLSPFPDIPVNIDFSVITNLISSCYCAKNFSFFLGFQVFVYSYLNVFVSRFRFCKIHPSITLSFLIKSFSKVKILF